VGIPLVLWPGQGVKSLLDEACQQRLKVDVEVLDQSLADHA